jgi:uncharacterized protein with HEPN domain
MLPNEKNDLVYLINILEYIGKIWKYTEKIDDADALFELNEQMNLNASLTLIANIGENVSKISDKLKQKYLNIDWKQINNFRNKIVHDYVGIDMAIIYEVITKDFKILKTEFEKVIKEQTEKKIFDIEEIKICKDSNYYRYIDFEKILY